MSGGPVADAGAPFPRRRPAKSLLPVFVAILLASAGASLFVGRYPLSVPDTARSLASLVGTVEGLDARARTIVVEIRLPRIVLGALVGASLAASGAAFQGAFRNPLVNSGILGVSNGAGFGAALAILLFRGGPAVYGFAFAFGVLAVALSYLVGKVYSSNPTIMLVLGGVIVSSVFASLISFLKYVADPFNQLPAIVFWLMGSLANAGYDDLLASAPPMAIGLAGLVAMRWRINVLSMGDREAQALGVDARRGKALVIAFATLATAGAVCVSGIIGWIGLIVPHIGRMLVGNDNRRLLPASLILGASFLVLVDDAGRMLTGSELPLGILTALMGGPFFVYLLKKTKGGGW